jgi:tRNA G10  N-methylase Trm11
VAGLKTKYTLLDPFAGYGSIPLEAVRGFGSKQTIAVDSQKLANRHEHPLIKWYQRDATKLDFIADTSIDRIITDPPWGSFDTATDVAALYANFTKEMIRVLKPDGVAVILSGFTEAAECFDQANSLRLIGSWKVLVSGKKATIFKLQKQRTIIAAR